MIRIATCLLAGAFLTVSPAVVTAQSASAACLTPVHQSALQHGTHGTDHIVDPITE